MKPVSVEKKAPTGWALARQQMKSWSRPALLALIKDLHDASAENRDFLLARFQAEDAGGEALEGYRTRIVEQFFPRRGFGKLKLAEARKAIRDYRHATGNVAGAIDLMLTFVESGTKFTREFGVVETTYYSRLASMMNEMSGLLCNEGVELYPRFRGRIRQLASHADHIGWGYGDYLRKQVHFLENELGLNDEN